MFDRSAESFGNPDHLEMVRRLEAAIGKRLPMLDAALSCIPLEPGLLAV